MSFDILPSLDDIVPRRFLAEPKVIDLITLALSAYLLLVIYPAYGVLRIVWTGDSSAFSLGGVATALLTAALFAVCARWTIRRYLTLKSKP